MNKLMTTLALTAVLLVPLIMSSAYATGATATGNVVIAGTCGVSLGSNAINYGTVVPGTTVTSLAPALSITNPGTAATLLTVIGGNWTDGIHDIILASNTGFSSTGIAPFTSLALHNVPVTINPALAPSGTVNTTWQLIATLLQPFAGSLTQSLTFSASC